MIKLFFIAVIVFAGMFGYKWYLGKTAPSLIDDIEVSSKESVAYFSGGCFWCVESDFEKLPEIKDAISGYMGGVEESPSYKDVASGSTKHRESVKIIYDPKKTTYRKLVLHLLKHTDPTDEGGSFYDRGRQYTSAIYYSNDTEKEIAEDVIRELNESGIFKRPVITSVEPASYFWIAEDYHQDYYKKSSTSYKYYRSGSGRDKFIESVWDGVDINQFLDKPILEKNDWESFKKPSKQELKNILTPVQYYITQEYGTEEPFNNEYWDNHEEGIYVDVVSGEPLFSSTDKFDSGTGWPSFLKPIDENFIVEKKDYKLIVPRTEIRSKYADSHLGHIIMDGPKENNYVRYCMNSASLRFVPKIDLEKEGLEEYVQLFTF